MANQLNNQQGNNSVLQTERSIASLLSSLLREPHELFDDTFQELSRSSNWYLWLEPIPKSTPVKCPAMVTDEGELTKILDEQWQFSEFMFFSEHEYVHGISVTDGSLLRRATRKNSESEKKFSPILRKDATARFQPAARELFDKLRDRGVSQLSLLELTDNETGAINYFLTETA